MCNDSIITHQQALIKRLWHEMHGEWDKDCIIACYQEINKDLRMEYIQKQRAAQNGFRTASAVNKDPSEKQTKYAKELGIEKPEQYTRKELSKKIEEKKKGGEN